MSIESFYANIRIENFKAEDWNSILEENSIFRSAFGSCWDDVDQELSISGALVSFFPDCEILFKLCQLINVNSKIVEIETRRMVHAFDFDEFIDFFVWFYGCWKERIENFHHDWGAFIVSTTDYYKVRQRLRKKYMLTY